MADAAQTWQRLDVEKLARLESALADREATTIRLPVQPARAAVAMTIDALGREPYLFFIHRAVTKRDPWSGHMAFPGGFQEIFDESLLETVHREVREEVGIDLERSARLLGRLDDVQGVARGRQLDLVITPFVFALREPVVVVPNEEVQAGLWVPLAWLEDPANESTMEWPHDDQVHRLPAFVYEGRTIWGLTFRMLQNLLAVLRGAPHP